MKDRNNMIQFYTSFNRYMVECEFFCCNVSLRGDTGFNRYMVECELIRRKYHVDLTMSFNRYMVECESILQRKRLYSFTVLIDTWWNVNKLVYTVQCTRNLF